MIPRTHSAPYVLTGLGQMDFAAPADPSQNLNFTTGELMLVGLVFGAGVLLSGYLLHDPIQRAKHRARRVSVATYSPMQTFGLTVLSSVATGLIVDRITNGWGDARMINLTINRTQPTDLSTIGNMLLNGQPFLVTLEPPILAEGVKIYGHTAIPPLKYRVVMQYSVIHKMYNPRLVAVPNFDAVEMHIGNTAKDTKACTLVGLTAGANEIYSSGVAYGKLIDAIAVRTGWDGKLNCAVLALKDPDTWAEYINAVPECEARWHPPVPPDIIPPGPPSVIEP